MASTSTEKHPNVTAEIVSFAHSLEYEDIPSAVLDHAKRMILDTCGVAILARDEKVTTAVMASADTIEQEPSPRSVPLPGTAKSGSPKDIGLVFGTMIHALDFDDVHHGMGGHPSAPILAAILPIATRERSSGRTVLSAFIAGVETTVCLANMLNPGHYERGWHPTAVIGTIGATLALGRLLGSDRDTLRRSVGIAVSQASGTKGNFGTMTKPFHIGMVARNSIEAATLADLGLTAGTDLLERSFGGFFDLFKGESPITVGGPLDALGTEWAILTPRVAFKPYPCCGSTHAAIDAALAIKQRTGPDTDEIRAITIREHPRRLDHTDRPHPVTDLDGKFSVQYVVGRALQQGRVWVDDFTDDAVTAPAIRSLLDRTTTVRDADAFADAEWGASVTVETDDGTLMERVDAPRGSADRPLPDRELREKFRRCTDGILDDTALTSTIDFINKLETLDDTATLVDTLTV